MFDCSLSPRERVRVRGGHYSSANYLIGDKGSLYKIESFGIKLYAAPRRKRGLAANSFTFLTGEHILLASKARFKWLEKNFIRKRNLKLKDFLSLGSFHNEKVPEAAVCRHFRERLGYTVSSIVFEITKDGKAHFYYAPGPPCTYQYKSIPLTS